MLSVSKRMLNYLSIYHHFKNMNGTGKLSTVRASRQENSGQMYRNFSSENSLQLANILLLSKDIELS